MGKIAHYIKLVKYLNEKTPLISAQLNLTNRCACKCLMCKKHEWHLGDISFEKISKILNVFRTNGVESIVLSGGDPLAYNQLEEVINLAYSNNLKIGMLTAGNLKFDNWENILGKLEWLRFSIDALDKELWMKIRGSSEKGYEFLHENLRKVSKILLSDKNYNVKIRANFCRLKDTNEDQEEKLKDYMHSMALDFMAHEVRVFEKYMNKKEHHDYVSSKCIIPFVHCIIEADGEVYPCCDVMNENASYEEVNKQYSLGNLDNFMWNFYDLWNSKKANEMKIKLFEHRVKECETCPTRYYPCNIEYEKEVNGAIFL